VPSSNHITSTLTPDEAVRAIYIDFEKRKNGPPVLLGACYAEGRRRIDEGRVVMRQDVLEPSFGHLAGEISWSWPDHLYRYDSDGRSLRASLGELLSRARNQDRLLVSWSQHELTVVEGADVGPGLLAEFRSRYRDGKATARRWLRRTYPDLQLAAEGPGDTARQMAKYFDIIGFSVPEVYGVRRTGDNLRRVEEGLWRGGYLQLTDRQQTAWEEVLGHNLYDCLGLRQLMLIASAELAGERAAA
jgi:hypothetical protein